MSELKTSCKKVDYDLSGLLNYIDIADIALPEINGHLSGRTPQVMAAIVRKGFASRKQP